jgi:hypothetical protein
MSPSRALPEKLMSPSRALPEKPMRSTVRIRKDPEDRLPVQSFEQKLEIQDRHYNRPCGGSSCLVQRHAENTGGLPCQDRD